MTVGIEIVCFKNFKIDFYNLFRVLLKNSQT